jgi:hypothetical protein
MTNGWRRRIGSSLGLSLALVALPAWAATGAVSVRVQDDALVAAASKAEAAVASLADGSPAVDKAQTFEVAEGDARIVVVPVRYSPKVPGPLRNVDSCALVITVGQQPSATVRTVGEGYTETVGCTGLDGIAFPDLDHDGRFEIALIYSTISPPAGQRKTPVILRRSKDGPFAVDEELGEALDRKGGITTLGKLRRAAIAQRK